jgi:hypothetical protein
MGFCKVFQQAGFNLDPPDINLHLHLATFTGVSHRYLAYLFNFKVFFEVLG